MSRIAVYAIILVFSFLFLAIGISTGNFSVSIIAGVIMFSFLVLIFTDKTSVDNREYSPAASPYPSPELSTPPPTELSHTAKLDKADEMRDNPTPAEKRMREILNSSVTANFPEHIFYPQSLQYGYILDFYCPTLHLAIEVDGGSHNNRRGYDWERDTHLARWGIQVLRANNDEVFNNPQALANSLCKIIQEKTTQQYKKNTTSAMRNNKGGYCGAWNTRQEQPKPPQPTSLCHCGNPKDSHLPECYKCWNKRQRKY
jgi:very-short-patch-repair endonuclease